MLRSRLAAMLSLTLILSGCGTTPPPPSPTISSKPTETIPPTIVNQATATQITLINPEPDFLDLPFANNVLFATPSDPACQLPCWQGLRVGISNRADVQTAVDTVFQFNGSIDLFGKEPTLPEYQILKVPGLYTTGVQWYYGENKEATFRTTFVVDESSGILQGIHFHSAPVGRYTTHSPADIVKNLGEPDDVDVRVSVFYGEPGKYVLVELWILYESGMAFFYREFPEKIPDTPDEFKPFCLVDKGLNAEYYIVSPFDVSGQDATPLQDEWIFRHVNFPRMPSTDKPFEITTAQFVEIASTGDGCLNLDYSDP